MVCRLLARLSLIICLLSVRAARAQEQPNLLLCEDTRVSLGHSKQQVKNTLEICCRFHNAHLPGKDGPREYPSQILFEAREGAGSCSGMVLFDTSDRLVYAERIFFGYGNEESTEQTLAQALFKAVRSLFTNPATTIDGAAYQDAMAQLVSMASGEQRNLQLAVGARMLEVNLDHAQRTTIVVNVGNLSKGDFTSVPTP